MQAIIFRMAWVSPAGSAAGSKFGPVRAVVAFSGVGSTLPYPCPVPGLLGAPARLGRGSGPASSGMTMLASSAAWLLALLLAFNLRPFRPRCRSM